MAYKKTPDGRFRLRASFDIPAELVERMNGLCERTGLSMASLCLFACERLATAGESGGLDREIAEGNPSVAYSARGPGCKGEQRAPGRVDSFRVSDGGAQP